MDVHWIPARHARNVYSQFGEDGIIEAALELIGKPTQWCVEFGAWDGIHLSNTCNLIKNHGYSAVLIEANTVKYRDLREFCDSHDGVTAIEAFVGFENHNCLDTLLANTSIPLDFDVLSIDIDGNDYHVWEAVKKYRPRLVVVEFNPTIPNAVEFVQSRDMSVSRGCSIRSLVALGNSKGYKLTACTEVNAIFVDSKYFDRFEITDNSVDKLRCDESLVTYMFHGYDGTILLEGHRRLVWHDLEIRGDDVQLLPKKLRKHPAAYGKWGRRFVNWIRYFRRDEAA